MGAVASENALPGCHSAMPRQAGLDAPGMLHHVKLLVLDSDRIPDREGWGTDGGPVASETAL